MSGDHSNGQALSREGFADLVEEGLLTSPDVTILARNDLDLTLRVGETDLHFNLENFYTAYQADHGQLKQIVARAVQSVRSFRAARNIQTFAELQARVYPMLKPAALLVTVRERQLPMLAYRPFLAELIVTYVIDEPSSVAFINEEHLERWEMNEQELHDHALENLRRRTSETAKYTTLGEGAQRLFIFSTQDGYDATRLLLPEMLMEWRSALPGNMVIGIPNRDFLIAFSDADRTVLANVARQVQTDAVERSYGLTERLFTLVAGEIREYEWD
ncbi:MAG: DUF1444 family protein [Chloroflexaceae bacterium]|jgi:uncharacterized protein YtpQ (UPF0354 family)|nr:DUF1444 family protein [Chloroflexaceae bacterium]